MPRRTDLETILIIGSGPIVIGQACEFDYSGTQACRVLRSEGYRIVLANSNPATIMTDPEFADRTYVEPLTPEVLTKIIERERPDAVLPTLGGQTALNLAMALAERGVVGDGESSVELIGANAEAIATAEDRERFKQAMIEIGLAVPASGTARSLDEAMVVVEKVGLPVDRAARVHPRGRGTGIATTPDRVRGDRRSRARREPDQRDPDRAVDRRVEGVRARGDARPRRQLRGRVLDRELRPDGRAHRRLDHRGARADAVRRRVPAHARRCVRVHPASGRRDRREQHPVRGRAHDRRSGRDRDEPARESVVRTGVEGDRLPHRQDRGSPRGRVQARRDPERHHPQDAGKLRAHDRLRRDEGAPLGIREASRHEWSPRHSDAVGR